MDGYSSFSSFKAIDLNNQTLRDLVTAKPQEYLGESIITKFGSSKELPFLFKVLSIEKFYLFKLTLTRN